MSSSQSGKPLLRGYSLCPIHSELEPMWSQGPFMAELALSETPSERGKRASLSRLSLCKCALSRTVRGHKGQAASELSSPDAYFKREKKRSRSCNFLGGSRKSYGTATTAAGSIPNSTSQLIISRQIEDKGPAENKSRERHLFVSYGSPRRRRSICGKSNCRNVNAS